MIINRIRKVVWLLFILTVLPLTGKPQDTIPASHFLFDGSVKALQTIIFQDVQEDWITSSMIHNRLNFKWLVSESLTAGVSMRNRLVYGDLLRSYPGYSESFEQSKGLFRLTKNVIDEKSFLFNTSIDRAWLGYSANQFQVTIGRQRINWGQTFVWNPNDIFNTYSYFDFDYEEKPGSDAVRLQYYSSPTSVLEVAAKYNNERHATIAGLFRFNR